MVWGKHYDPSAKKIYTERSRLERTFSITYILIHSRIQVISISPDTIRINEASTKNEVYLSDEVEKEDEYTLFSWSPSNNWVNLDKGSLNHHNRFSVSRLRSSCQLPRWFIDGTTKP